MALWDWIAAFPMPTVAIPATPATDSREGRVLSQESQGVGVGAGDEKSAGIWEALEERAAIMEFDGGLSRRDAERLASISSAMPSTLEMVSWRGADLDVGDLRRCEWCRNFTRSGRCLAAWRGELRAARDWRPTLPDLPQRCVGYTLPLMTLTSDRGEIDGPI